MAARLDRIAPRKHQVKLSPMDRLTPRQREVANLLLTAETNRGIAKQLRLTDSVVKNHMREIFDRLGVWTRLELAVLLVQHEALEHDA